MWTYAPRIVLIAIAITAALPGVAGAQALGSFTTPNCAPGTPNWRVYYRVFDANAAGGRLRTGIPEILEDADAFTRHVGELSECAITTTIDVVREPSPFPVDPWRDEVSNEHYPDPPPGYDSAMAAVPTMEEHPGGTTVSRSALLGNPWSMLMVHEWMHQVVSHYTRIRQGWPRDDVHGNYNRPEYQDPGVGDGVNHRWFNALMTGRANENGTMKGILRDEWAHFGTPARVRHVDPGLRIHQSRDPSRNVLTVSTLAGSARIRLRDMAGAVAHETIVRVPRRGDWFPSVDWPVPATLRPGRYRACAENPATDTFDAAEACVNMVLSIRAAVDRRGFRLDMADSMRLLTTRTTGRTLALTARGPLLRQRAAVVFTSYRCDGTGNSRTACRSRVTRRRSLRLTANRVAIPLPPRGYRIGQATVTVPSFVAGRQRWPGFRSTVLLG